MHIFYLALKKKKKRRKEKKKEKGIPLDWIFGILLAVSKPDFYVHSSEKMMNKYNVGRTEEKVRD